MLPTLWAKLDSSHASVVDDMNLITANRIGSKILAALNLYDYTENKYGMI